MPYRLSGRSQRVHAGATPVLFLALLLFIMTVPVAPISGTSDSAAPTLVEFDFTPKTVDSSAGAVEVVLTARITDDLAGVANSSYSSSPTQVRFQAPSGQFVDGILVSDQHLVAGTARDGVYESFIELPKFSEQGTWTVEYFLLVDQVGNYRYLYTADLNAMGLPTELEQSGLGDSAPPVLQSFNFTPKSVDTSSSSVAVKLTARITDDAAGVAGAGYSSSPTQVRFESPSGQIVDGLFESNQHLVSGTPLDGQYETTMVLPASAEQGTWEVAYFLLVDQVGNYRYLYATDLKASGFPTELEQVGAGDTTPPVLQSFSFRPVNVDTASSSAEITLNARITDDAAGVADSSYSSSPTQVRFQSPSGQSVDGLFVSDQNRVSGNRLDGVYESHITLPMSSERGNWQVEYFLLVDQAGNQRYLYPDDLAEMGSYPAFAVDPFDDVYDSPFFDDIGWLIVNGVTKGCNPPLNDEFCPNEPITRGQMAAFLNRYLSLPTGAVTFIDTEGHLFQADIAALAEAGITKGCNPPVNDLFCPEDQVTRGQMAAFLSRAMSGLPEIGVSRDFTDTTEHVFSKEIHWLAATGVTKGCNPPANDRFCPEDPVTRGQMAAFLRRAAGG